MPKHTKKGPTFERDERGNKERFLEYCKLYLSHFVKIGGKGDCLIAGLEVQNLSEFGFVENGDNVKFDRPGSVDYWVDWFIEQLGVEKPKLSYTDFISGLDYE